MEKLTGKAGLSQFCRVWIRLLVYKMSDDLEVTTRQEKFMLLFVIVLIFLWNNLFFTFKKSLSLLVFGIVEVQGHSLLLLRNKDICSLQ